jgi:hypothetical protein
MSWDTEEVAPAKATKKPVRKVTKTIELNNLDFTVNGNSIFIEVPAVEIELPNHMPFISEEIRDWSINEKIPESDYSDAYEAARDSFLLSLETSSVYRFLKEHTIIAKN